MSISGDISIQNGSCQNINIIIFGSIMVEFEQVALSIFKLGKVVILLITTHSGNS